MPGSSGDLENHKLELENHRLELETHKLEIEARNLEIDSKNREVENYNDEARGYGSAVFWGLLAVGGLTVGIAVAVLAGYLLGHFTHVRTKTVVVAARTVTVRGASTPAQTSPATVAATAWTEPNGGALNTRDVGGPINAQTVSKLGLAWTVPITAVSAYGGYATTPVTHAGVVYTEDLESNVEALNLTSGKVLWKTKYNSVDVGPNGVTYANGMVYGTTGSAAFALNATTGKQIWKKNLSGNNSEGIDMAPGYDDGDVYVSTLPIRNLSCSYCGNGQAVLYSLNAATGKTVWKFAEVPKDLWSKTLGHLNSGGGLWYPPTFDGQGNLYIGVANPAPFAGTVKYPWGSSRPGPDLYTDSLVKLNQKTGKLEWYYQLTPHDLYDWDLENSPILSGTGASQIAIDGGKAGIMIGVSAQTGKLLWKTPVGVHDGHTNDGLLAMDGQAFKLHTPEVIEPGDLGGVESQLASNGTTVFAAVNNLPVTYTGNNSFADIKLPAVTSGTGDLVAVDEKTGKIEWDDKLPSSPYGGATIANNVVFTTTYNGMVLGFNESTGKEIWHSSMPAGTNAPVAVFGNTLVTAASVAGAGQKAMIVAYRLGAKGAFPSAAGTAGSTTSNSASSTSTSSTSASSTGAGSTATGSTATGSTGTSSTASPAPVAGTNTVAIAASPSGTLMFTASKLTAKAGKVTIAFTNRSPLAHDVVLINSANKILGQTPVFQGGTKSFIVTLTAGTYTYYCSVPGHREAGMQGTLTVTAATPGT